MLKKKPKSIPAADKYERVPLFAKIALILFAACIVIYIISALSDSFADFFNLHIAGAFRFMLAQITNLIPISIAELLLILSPVLLGLVLWYLLKFRCKTQRAALISIVCILSTASLLFSSFVLTFSSGYRGSTLSRKLELDEEAISANELYQSTLYLADKVNELSQDIEYGDDGFSIMPYGYGEMSDKLIDAYEIFCQDNDFINNFHSRIKPVMLSRAMSYTHTTGIYTFFTGEANLNVDFPDYTLPYTAAHELAHQRGIAREDEANLIAFLVSIESSDTYILYSAYLNMYEYIASALYKADYELYKDALNKLDKKIISELVAYSDFFDQYRESNASKVSGTFNDVYLKAQGTAGKKSYGMVVDLAVAYFKRENLIQKQ